MAVGQEEVLPGLVIMEDQEPEVAFLTLKVDLSANEEPGLTEAEAASDCGFVRIEGWDE